MNNAKLSLDGNEYELPVRVGSEGEVGVDISSLRKDSGAITFDPGYGNTGSCESAITFINGEKGILRHRGYPIEELAEKASFEELIAVLVYDRRLSKGDLQQWRHDMAMDSFLHDDMLKILYGFPYNAHPMSVLSSMVAALSAFYGDDDDFERNVTRLIAKTASVAAFNFKRRTGQPATYPVAGESFASNFLRMAFGTPVEEYDVPEVLEKALNMLLIVHADHEQNCSASTARMVGSSQANIYASMAAAICGLWGPRHVRTRRCSRC